MTADRLPVDRPADPTDPEPLIASSLYSNRHNVEVDPIKSEKRPNYATIEHWSAMTEANEDELFRLGSERITGERLWTATFEPSDEWLIERQKPGSSVAFEDGRLRVDAIDERGVTVWTRQEFPADILVEYEATCHEPDGTLSSRNLNCFLCAADDEPLCETERNGAYPEYHDFPNYIFTLTRTHSRLRRDPGFEEVSEIMLGVQPDESYRVQLLKRGDRLTACVNGRVLHDWTDADPHGAGWVGLRTYDTNVTYDSWSVYGITEIGED